MPDKNTSSEQSRLNGAKSKGPITAEGKARSSANAIKHGFAAAVNVVLRIEDQPAFTTHVAKVHAAYKPTDYAEETFVDQIAAIQWRQSRLVALETALIDAQVGNHDRTLTEMWPGSSNDEYFHLVKAWQALARPPQQQPAVQVEETVSTTNTPPEDFDITSIELVRRYQVSLDRQLRNTLLNLRQYRKDFAAPPPQPASPPPAPNEPEATPPPPPPTPVEPQTNPPIPVQAQKIVTPLRLVTPVKKQ